MPTLTHYITRGLDGVGLRRDGRIRSYLNEVHDRLLGPSQRELAEPFESFSQFGEDAVLNAMLQSRTGRYVDVGSGHPVRGSNTYAFYERGWRGVLIDPIAANIELAREVRPEDEAIRAFCGREAGEVDFYEFPTYEFSTGSTERAAQLGPPKAVYKVPSITIASLNIQATPADDVILFIDVEGAEMDVLAGNDWERFLPSMIVVEEWNGPLGHTTPMYDYLVGKGYNLVAIAGFSSIYHHADYEIVL